MQIETYELEEQGSGADAVVEAEAMEIAQKLGLEGQLSLTKPKEDGGVRFQYPEMTAQELAVYKAVFPARTDIKRYDGGVIPVRVLQVAAHALEFCDSVEVWHKKYPDPDPVLVGRIGPDYSPKKTFRLARWGEALKDFSELMKEAEEIIRAQTKEKLEDAIAEAKERLGRLDSLVAKKLRGEHVHESFHTF